jgi:tRNA-dependent cyclodipeptide synthase
MNPPATPQRPVVHIPELIQSNSWIEMSMADLITVQRAIGRVLKTKRTPRPKKKKGPPAPPATMVGAPGYRANLAMVAPATLELSAEHPGRCVLGISLGGPSGDKFTGPKLAAMLRWVAARFSSCLILPGDSLARLTVQVRHGSSPGESRAHGRALGKAWIEEHRQVVEEFNGEGKCEFTVKCCSEIEQCPGFAAHHAGLRAFHSQDAPFQTTVNSFSEIYLGRGEADEASQEKVAVAREYLLEEMALFACLVESGWPTLVYPGSIKTFAAIAEGTHPGLPEPLQSLQFISLRFKRCGATLRRAS